MSRTTRTRGREGGRRRRGAALSRHTGVRAACEEIATVARRWSNPHPPPAPPQHASAERRAQGAGAAAKACPPFIHSLLACSESAAGASPDLAQRLQCRHVVCRGLPSPRHASATSAQRPPPCAPSSGPPSETASNSSRCAASVISRPERGGGRLPDAGAYAALMRGGVRKGRVARMRGWGTGVELMVRAGVVGRCMSRESQGASRKAQRPAGAERWLDAAWRALASRAVEASPGRRFCRFVPCVPCIPGNQAIRQTGSQATGPPGNRVTRQPGHRTDSDCTGARGKQETTLETSARNARRARTVRRRPDSASTRRAMPQRSNSASARHAVPCRAGAVHPHLAQSSPVESSSIESSRVQSSRVQSSRVESSRVESSRGHSSPIESSRVHSTPLSPSLAQSNPLPSRPVHCTPVSPGPVHAARGKRPKKNQAVGRSETAWICPCACLLRYPDPLSVPCSRALPHSRRRQRPRPRGI